MDSYEIAQRILELEEDLEYVETHCDTETKIYVQKCFMHLHQARKLNDMAIKNCDEGELEFMEGVVNLLSSMILASESYCIALQTGTKRVNRLLAQAGKISSQLN